VLLLVLVGAAYSDDDLRPGRLSPALQRSAGHREDAPEHLARKGAADLLDRGRLVQAPQPHADRAIRPAHTLHWSSHHADSVVEVVADASRRASRGLREFLVGPRLTVLERRAQTRCNRKGRRSATGSKGHQRASLCRPRGRRKERSFHQSSEQGGPEA
jgi:hypothetical protein